MLTLIMITTELKYGSIRLNAISMYMQWELYHQTSNISCTKFQHFDVSLLVL